MGLRRLVIPVAGSVVLVALALMALGPPDVADAVDFFLGSLPSSAGAQAAVAIVLWLLVLVLAGAALVAAGREAADAIAQLRRRQVQAVAVLLLGIAIFAGGLLRHQRGLAPICCGDITQAQRLTR